MPVVPLKKKVWSPPCPPTHPHGMPSNKPIAKPAREPHYIIPGSHFLDPPFGWETPWWPFPRPPWPFETESRAPGTGLIWGHGKWRPPKPPAPCPPPPCPPPSASVTPLRRK